MGAAQTIGNRAYCSACVPASEVKTILSPTPVPVPVPATAPAPKRPLPLVLGAAAVAVLAVVAAGVLFRSSKPATPPPGSSAPPSTGISAPSRPTPLPEKDPAARKQRIDNELQALKVRVDPAVNGEHFGAAISLLREARKSYDAAEWTGPIDERIRELQQTADNLYSQLLEQAVEGRKRGALKEVDAIKQRVTQWAMPVHSTTLEQALAAIKIADPLPGFGLKLVPGSGAFGVHRRHGVQTDKGVEAVPFGVGRAVGFEGDLFQAPSDGEVQLTFVTTAAQTIQIRLQVVGEKGRLIPYEFTVRGAAVGTPVQVKASLSRFSGANFNGPPAGSIVKQLYVQGQDSKVVFRVTELIVIKRRD